MALNIADKYVKRALTLFRVAEGEAIEVSKALENVYKGIVDEMKEEFKTPTSIRKIRKLEDKINKRLDNFYGEVLPDELVAASAIAIKSELTWNVQTLLGEVAQKIQKPNRKIVAARAASKTYQGHNFDFWVKKEFPKNVKRVRGALRSGFINNNSIRQIENKLITISRRSRADVRTIVRSNFMHNAVEAKNSVFDLNPNVIEGAIWISILDNRTTPLICGIRDGLEYDRERNPLNDHGIPWDAGPGRLHWNCRSTEIPMIIGVKGESLRPTTEPGEKYTRGDNTTRTGRVRKNRKDSRDREIFKTGTRTTKTKYEGWLRAQSKKNLDFTADILGSESRARAFRDGKVSLIDLGMESPVARPLIRSSL